MRNVTALSILLPRIRSSQIDQELLSEGIYPSSIKIKNKGLLLGYVFKRSEGKALYKSYTMFMRGKARFYIEVDFSTGMDSSISETRFINRILDLQISEDFELIEKEYELSEADLKEALETLYDW